MAASTSSATLHETPGLSRSFHVQLGACGATNLGDGLIIVLVPLVALQLTDSPTVLALLSAAAWLSWLLCGIPVGVLIDRWDRRTAQLVALVVRALLLGTAAVLALAGMLTVPLLFALVLLHGVTEVVIDLGVAAIVPALVPVERLATANGRILGVQQVANNFLGAPLAGALMLVGAAAGLGVAAVLAVVAAVVLLGLRGSFRPTPTAVPDRTTSLSAAFPAQKTSPSAAFPAQKTSPSATFPAQKASRSTTQQTRQVREGLLFLWRHPVLRPLTFSSALLNLGSTAYLAVFVLWAVAGPASGMHLSPSVYALLMVGFAVGAVAGSLMAEAVRTWLGEMPAMVGCITVNVVLLLVPVVWPHGWVAAGALAVVGMLNTIGNVVSQSLRQRLVPGRLLGRVTGAGRTLSYGMMPLGALLGGVVAEVWGLQTTFYSAVAFSLLVCLYLGIRVRTRDIAAAEY